jgi:hypothetical protein
VKARILRALNTLLTAAPIFALWHSLTASDLSSAEQITAFLLGFAAAEVHNSLQGQRSSAEQRLWLAGSAAYNRLSRHRSNLVNNWAPRDEKDQAAKNNAKPLGRLNSARRGVPMSLLIISGGLWRTSRAGWAAACEHSPGPPPSPRCSRHHSILVALVTSRMSINRPACSPRNPAAPLPSSIRPPR